MAVKTWKAKETSPAGIQIAENSATIAVASAGKLNGLHIDETGVYLRGKISMMTRPDQIRVGGFWVFNSPFKLMMPSTMAFPMPTIVFNTPMSGFERIAEATQHFQSELV